MPRIKSKVVVSPDVDETPLEAPVVDETPVVEEAPVETPTPVVEATPVVAKSFGYVAGKQASQQVIEDIVVG